MPFLSCFISVVKEKSGELAASLPPDHPILVSAWYHKASDREGAFSKSSRVFPGTEGYQTRKQTSRTCHAG